MSRLKKQFEKKNITPPNFVVTGLQYECIMGSTAYGVNTDQSDLDIYGFCIPPRNIVFPMEGEIFISGFDNPNLKKFEQYQQHHVNDDEAGIEYDFDITSLSKFFRQLANGTPNKIDALFVPRRCITYTTKIGELIRENRHLFLSNRLFHSFKGYAFSQLNKMKTKKPEGKRVALVEKFGFDVKFAAHTVRLLDEIEQILTEKDLDLQRSRKMQKYIREGGWSLEQVEKYFHEKEIELEKINNQSDLPHYVREEEIRELLLECLKLHFTDDKITEKQEFSSKKVLEEINEVLMKYFNR